jgi:glycosyltransferase involved in cell wall biosynthesis
LTETRQPSALSDERSLSVVKPESHRAAGVDRSQVPVVVVGGYEYSPEMNQPQTLTVRELARSHTVLYLHSESHGSVLRRVQGRAPQLGARDVVRTVMGPTRARRVEERLWLAPVRGLSAIAPLSNPEFARRRNIRSFGKLIRGWLGEVGASECLLLFYWWALPELVDTVPHVASIYDCTDEHAALPGSLIKKPTVERLEGRLLDAVDRAYVVSAGLVEGRRRDGRRVTVLPNGFDTKLFGELERRGFEVPEAIRSIRRPIVGYVGALNQRMDWELLIELADRRADWSFVLVGSDPRAAPSRLHQSGNVHFPGALAYSSALAAISRFDAAVMPVRLSEFSQGNSPLKLRDYFAHGAPVVATRLPDTESIATSRPGLLCLADDVEQWEAALTDALNERPDSPLRAARRQFIEESSVEQRVARMLEEALKG